MEKNEIYSKNQVSKGTEGRKKLGWLPPDTISYLPLHERHSKLYSEHPKCYLFVSLLSIAVFFLPSVIFFLCLFNDYRNEPWLVIGWLGSTVFGLGLYNLLSIILNQYLGHLISIATLTVGGALVLLSLRCMGII